MDFDALNKRCTYLLQGETVEWVRQDGPRHLTIQFKRGPQLSMGIPRQRQKELDISITAHAETDATWIARAESPDAPDAPKR